MRPKSTTTDLPSSYDVKIQLHNKFVKHIRGLKDKISVSKSLSLKGGRVLTGHVDSSRESICYRGWMVSQYDEDGISWHDSALDQVKDAKWKLRAEVIGFKALSGAHSGENLGRYAVELLDCMGIMDKKQSKV